jgi:hypothetical protein
MKWKVIARYTFEVEWEVEATDKDDARRIVENECECTVFPVSENEKAFWTMGNKTAKVEILKPKFVEKEDKE